MIFSIIIPVYNVAPYLRECLDSVLTQTFIDWECICVDDGSTDGSGTILDEYTAKDARFKIFHKENGGVSSARNLALDQAKGEWIAFLDGDDKISEDRLQAVYDIAEKHPQTDWIRLWYQDWYGENPVNLDDFSSKELYCGQLHLKWAWGCLARLSVPWINYYKATIVQKVRFNQSLSVYEDYIFELQLLPYISEIYQGAHNGYFYRHLSNSAFHRPQCLEVYCKLFEVLFQERKQQFLQELQDNDSLQIFTLRVLNILLHWHQRCKCPSLRARWRVRNLFLKAIKEGLLKPSLFEKKNVISVVFVSSNCKSRCVYSSIESF